MSTKITSLTGMQDLVDPNGVAQWQRVEWVAQKIFSQAGFQEIRTPHLEDAGLFERSVGETTEIVEKEMYILEGRGGKRLALRPEGTASIVRAFIQHFTSHNILEGRFYYQGPMFRAERPQRGRYRQFHQIGAELFGNDHPLADAELMALVSELFQKLGLSEIELQLNSLGSGECRKKYAQALKAFLQKIKEQLCEDCERRIDRNPLRALDCKKEACIKATQAAPVMPDYLSEESRNHFEEVQAGLKTLQVNFRLNPRLVRGLDYYEKTVFEWVSPELGAQNTVAAGGRYNHLVHELGGPQIPALGFALGMERLVDILPKKESNQTIVKRIYLMGLDEDSNLALLPLLPKLRQAKMICQLDFGGTSLKSKMRRASKWEASHVVILGAEEQNKDVVVVRDMAQSEQNEINFTELEEYLRKI